MILLPLRIPVELAKTLATLDQLSGGRLIAGVALGRKDGYPAFGLTEQGRVRRFEEAVALLKRLWTEPGGHLRRRVLAADARSRSSQSPCSNRIHRCGSAGWLRPRLRRLARLADGWIGAGSASTADFAAAHAVLREALEAEGRDAATFPVAKRVYVAVDDDRERARAGLRDWFRTFYGGPDLADRVAVFGPAGGLRGGTGRGRARGRATDRAEPGVRRGAPGRDPCGRGDPRAHGWSVAPWPSASSRCAS